MEIENEQPILVLMGGEVRDSVVFYRSFWEAIEDLPEADFKQAVTALMQYSLDGMEPDVSGAAKTFFRMAKPQVDANNKRYLNGTKGGKSKTKDEPKPNQKVTKTEPKQNQDATKTEPKPDFPKPKENEKEKENVKENDKECVSTRAQEGEEDVSGCRQPSENRVPTLENVIEYCRENGLCVDAGYFFDYYTSRGWVSGNTPIADWKAVIRNWDRQDRLRREREKSSQKPPNRFHNFEQRDTDYNALVLERLNERLRSEEEG